MSIGRPFVPGPVARLLTALACALMVAGCEIRFGSRVSLFDDERAVATALSAMKSHFSGPVRAYKLLIADDHMVFQTIDPRGLRQVAEFRMHRQHHTFFSLDRVVGPYPAQFGAMPVNRSFEEALFRLDEVDLSGWGKLADAAIARAGLTDKNGVASIELSRPSVAMPRIGAGAGSGRTAPVRWTVEVKSVSETVLVFADVKGEITGVDLSGTNMMRNLDMYQRPELAAEAAAEIHRQAGNEPILKQVSFSSRSIGFTTTLKDDSYPIASIPASAVYNWSPSGLQRAAGSANIGSRSEVPFAVNEVDWSLLPKIVADARTRLAMPNGRVTGINITKPANSVRAPAPVWTIRIEENRERGEYIADTKGVMKTVLLPDSRRKPVDWLQRDSVVEALGRIVEEFGPDSKFQEVRFYDSYVRIEALDPRKPGEPMEVHLRERGFSRWGSVMFPKRREDDFAHRDLQLVKNNIGGMLDRTRTELNMPQGHFADVIVGRNNAEPSRNKGITVQVRAEQNGVGAGYVVFEADGSVVKVTRLTGR